MSRILVLAKSGFGKTTSYCGREKYDVKGLDPKETFVIQCIGREIPNKEYKHIAALPIIETNKLGEMRISNLDVLETGNRIQVDTYTGMDRYYIVALMLLYFKSNTSKIRNIVIDDFNYLAQDYYMANAMKGGWDTAKQIGYGMGKIFDAMRGLPDNKNIICCAHYEEYKDKNGDSISYRFKSVGNMVDGYIVPEAKFDIVLFGKSAWDAENKKAVKTFVKEYDGDYPAKDASGLLDELPNEFPNDLSIIVEEIKKTYN